MQNQKEAIRMSVAQRPKSDLGTIVIHWLMAAALFVAALSGLSILTDTYAWLRILEAALPGDSVWSLHLLSGLLLLASTVMYFTYVKHANLTHRIKLDVARFKGLFLSSRPRWAAMNVILYWFFFAALILEIGTGILLFFGTGGLALSIHIQAMWFCLAFPFLHILFHWLYGGQSQLLRIVRPISRLAEPQPQFVDVLIARVQQLEAERQAPHPAATLVNARDLTAKRPKTKTVFASLTVAAATGLGALSISPFIDRNSLNILTVLAVDGAGAPNIDGDISDAAWRRAPVGRTLAQHGADGDEESGSEVEVRALHDDKFVYFAFVWEDPTRSLKHMPLVKHEDGWHLMRSAPPGNETRFYEDKFAILLSHPGEAVVGKGIHLGSQPLPAAPPSGTGRGLHYLTEGLVDVWQWRASHNGPAAWIEDNYIAAPAEQPARSSQRSRGGFASDPGLSPYEDNFDIIRAGDTYPLIRPKRLPKDRAQLLQIGRLNLDPEASDSDTVNFWLTQDESRPYSEILDRDIPSGTIIPSIVFSGKAPVASDFSDVTGQARWAGGRWTLELKRRLDTGSPFDLPIKSGMLMWVATFDHAETRHSYHVRPFVLEMK